MFDESLLESSPLRTSILKKSHYLLAAAAGALTSLAWFFALARLARPSALEARGFSPAGAMAVQSLLVGVLAAIFALTLCYVYGESRQLALNTPFWLALTCFLSLPGFVCFLIHSAGKTGDWKRAAIPCVYGVEVVLVGAMALVPLIYTEALPKAFWTEVLHAPIAPPSPPASLGTQTPRRARRPVIFDGALKAPPLIPATIAQVHDEPLPPAQFSGTSIGIIGGIGGGQPGAMLDPVLRNILRNAAPQPLPPQSFKTVPPQRIRVGGIVSAARLVYQVKPEYPALARMARIEGDVEFEAVISRSGTIEELKVLKGHALLVKAALDAVRQWRYQPTLLDGEPVEVLTEIIVNFRLSE